MDFEYVPCVFKYAIDRIQLVKMTSLFLLVLYSPWMLHRLDNSFLLAQPYHGLASLHEI